MVDNKTLALVLVGIIACSFAGYTINDVATGTYKICRNSTDYGTWVEADSYVFTCDLTGEEELCWKTTTTRCYTVDREKLEWLINQTYDETELYNIGGFDFSSKEMLNSFSLDETGEKTLAEVIDILTKIKSNGEVYVCESDDGVINPYTLCKSPTNQTAYYGELMWNKAHDIERLPQNCIPVVCPDIKEGGL